jgi:preprotein translocase subunit SecA
MIQWFVKKVLGTKNQREVKRLWPMVERINALEKEYQSLMDEQLVAKTTLFKERVGKGETLDALLPEAFAVVKNACRRLTERKHVALVRGHRGDGDGRGQDAGGDVSGLPECVERARRACGDGE